MMTERNLLDFEDHLCALGKACLCLQLYICKSSVCVSKEMQVLVCADNAENLPFGR